MNYYNTKNNGRYRPRYTEKKGGYYNGGYKRGDTANRGCRGRRNDYPQHTLRDNLYAALTCLGAACFAGLWTGLVFGSFSVFLVGLVASAFALVTVVRTFIRTYLAFRRRYGKT